LVMPDAYVNSVMPGTGVSADGVSAGTVLARGQRGAEAVFRDSPEIVLNAIHQGDGDLFPLFTHVFFRLRDVAFLPGHTEIIGNPADDLPGVIAQVTPWFPQQGNSRCGRRAHRYPWPEYPGGAHSAVPSSSRPAWSWSRPLKPPAVSPADWEAPDVPSADGAAPSSR
jgi:hypothetical protein